jgi:hypothetical protein
VEEPEHGFEAALWKIRRGEVVEGVVAWAHEIWSSLLQREVMQAWLLARGSDEAIHRWLRIPSEVTQAYRYLFFDVDIFRDELDILSWVNEYEQEREGSEHGVQLLQIAVMEGVDKLTFLYGRGEAEMDPDKVQYVAMTEAYHRGRAHRGASVSSKEAQAAHAFMNTAAKIAQGLGKKGSPDLGGLRLKLKFNDQTEPVAEAAERGEVILH